ncbi:MAG: CcdB family protein [Methylomonas sp.]
MAQFTVYQNKNPQTKSVMPFLLDVQADLLRELQTCVVVPLSHANKNSDQMITKLMPILVVEGENYMMITPQMAGIARRDLGKAVANLADSRHEIMAAIDFLYAGF